MNRGTLNWLTLSVLLCKTRRQSATLSFFSSNTSMRLAVFALVYRAKVRQ